MDAVLFVVLVVVGLFMTWRRYRRRSMRWEPETTETMLADLAGRPLWKGARWQGRTADDPWL